MIIGITGPAMSGKTTAANILKPLLPSFSIYSFATPMKYMLIGGLGLTHDQVFDDQKTVVDPRYDKTPREILQTLGTEWGRQMVHPDIWVNALDSMIDGNGIIDDVRFENEAEYVRKHGRLIHIKGRNMMKDDHVSEAGVKQIARDIVIWNDGTLDDFYQDLVAMLGIYEKGYSI